MSFSQQSIPGIRIVLTVKNIIFIFVSVAVIFISVGLTVLRWSWLIPELEINYSTCKDTPIDAHYIYFGSSPIMDVNLGWTTRTSSTGSSQCLIDFYLPDDIVSPLIYYQLDNFYQSNRAFVKSFSYAQFVGDAVTDQHALTKECGDVTTRNGKIIYPCGMFPNTMFNDSLVVLGQIDKIGAPLGANLNYLTNVNIGWKSRESIYKPTSYNLNDILSPANWDIVYNATNLNIISTSPQFRVWTHIAAFPTFRKLWSRLNSTLKAGYYRIIIDDEYPESVYGSTKSIIITTTNVLGGRNTYLGLFCILAGLLYLFGAGLIYAKNKQMPRVIGDSHLIEFMDDLQSSPVAQSLDNMNITIRTIQRRKTRDFSSPTL